VGEFCTVEGVDGAGKSHLINVLRAHLRRCADPDIVVVGKDDSRLDGHGWAERRMATMHALTWGYDPAEPVWDYPVGYWLHSLAAWYTLFYDQYVAGPLGEGKTVLTDGWYFKHLARFHLSEDPAFIAQADQVLGSLAQPGRVLKLATPIGLAAHRRGSGSKPSEHGAFHTGRPHTDQGSFMTYQTRTARMLDTLLAAHSATVHTITPPTRASAVLNLLTRPGSAR